MKKFHSKFEKLEQVSLPGFSDTRIMMMPFIIGDLDTIPDVIVQWKEPLAALSAMSGYSGETGYITIDEKEVIPGKTHRRLGKHVDGVYYSSSGSWGGGKGGSWGGGRRFPVIDPETPTSTPVRDPFPSDKEKRLPPAPGLALKNPVPISEYGTGFLTVSSHAGCKAWQQDFIGWPGPEGECEHIATQCHEENATVFEPNSVYWVDPLCVHESLPMKEITKRQFVRLSLPSEGAWFEGWTKNPLGVMPTGPILPPRPDTLDILHRS